MDDLMIPPFFQHNLIRGIPAPPITQLRPWQKEILGCKEWQERKSCVCVAPTSGGKTLISEVAIAQTLDDNPYAKIIYALPFVSLASEKYLDIEKRFSRYSIRPFFQNIGGSDFRNGSVAICTYEKAHSLLNQAITCNYVNSIKLIILDEAHMIGDESRGIVAESLVMKVRSLETQPQVIALTATLNAEDANRMAKFVGGYSYVSQTRTAPLRMFTALTDGSLYNITKTEVQKMSSIQLKNGGKEIVVPLVLPLLSSHREQSVLIFVNFRKEARRVAILIAEAITNKKESEVTESIKAELTKCPGGADPSLVSCVEKGVAFHHAGLLIEERRAIERGVKEGAISAIVATTTLSAGVNLRCVSRVVILQPYRFCTETKKKVLISPASFAQMAGRAGRTEKAAGEVVMVVQSEKELEEIVSLMRAPIPDITSNSSTDGVFSYMLQSLSLGITQSQGQMDSFLKTGYDDNTPLTPNSTPQCSQTQNQGVQLAANGTFMEKGLTRLRELGLIEKSQFSATKLGSAVTVANLSADEGVFLNNTMHAVMKSACLTDELHMLTLCVPTNSKLKVPPLKEKIWEIIFVQHETTTRLITGYDKKQIERLIISSCRGGQLSKTDYENFERLYAGCILLRIISEVSIQKITEEFSIDRGTIQTLQNSSAARAGQAARFADAMGFTVIAAALVKFRKRLNFAVKEELLDLMILPSCNREIARILYNSGNQTPSDTAEASISCILKAVKKSAPLDNEQAIQNTAKKILQQAKKYVEHLAILQEFEDDVLAKMSNA